MKLSYVLSTQQTQFQAVAFQNDFDTALARLAALGYDGVELAVRDPASLDSRALRAALDRHRLPVSAIGTGQAYVEEKLSFTDDASVVRERALFRVKSHITLARELNALLIIGLIRGKTDARADTQKSRTWLVNALASIARTASESDVRIVIEPINRYETNLLNTVAETLELLETLEADNVGVLFDTFHANIEEPSIEASLRACVARLFHVHLADSNRWAPGFWHTDCARLIATLREMRYDGWLSAEILPKPSAEQAMEQTVRVLRPLIEK